MTLSKKDRGRLTRLRARHPSLTSEDLNEAEFEEVLSDSKEVLSQEVREVVGTGGVLSFDGSAMDELIDSYLDLRIELAINEANGGDPSNGRGKGRGKGRPITKIRDGSVPRRVSEMRRLKDLDPSASFIRGKLVNSLNKLTDGN